MSTSHLKHSGIFTTKPENFTTYCDEVLRLYMDSEEIIQAGRNTLKTIVIEGTTCVIKAFRIPNFPQDYGYGIFAKSKAHKSYDNASKLIELGFLSPKPIGYFDYRSKGKLINSYYLCEYEENTKTLDQLLKENPALDKNLIHQFTEFSYKLHQNGVLHRDFNPKNILISTVRDEYTFSLVDINRITWFKKLSLQQSMHSLSRLPFNDKVNDALVEHYAHLAKVELDQCHTLLNQSKAKTQRYFRNKKRFRKIFPKRKK